MIYFGFLTATEPDWARKRSIGYWLGDVEKVQACLSWLERIRKGREHDRYYMPYVFAMLLKHHYGDEAAATEIAAIKGRRRFPDPKEATNLEISWERIQSARKRVSKELKGTARLSQLDKKQVARASDLLLLLFLMTRPVRVRNIVAAEIGEHLLKDDRGRWRYCSPDYQVKNASELKFELPSDFAKAVEIYQALRKKAAISFDSGPVFLNRKGERASAATIRSRTKAISEEFLDVGLSPHAFRGALASAYAAEHPEDTGATQSLLGHTTMATTLRYYLQPDSQKTRERISNWLEKHPALERLQEIAGEI
jgi:integrase